MFRFTADNWSTTFGSAHKRIAVRVASAMRRWLVIARPGLLVLAIAACADDITEVTNVIEPRGGAIFGRVMPPTQGTEVAAWQAVKVKSVIVDAEGFFTISELNEGLYNVIVTAPSGLHREVENVEVTHERSASLGIIELIDLPSPLVGFSPSDGDTNVSIIETRLYLLTEVPLDVLSLNTAVAITPSISGHWEQTYSSDSFSYYFRLDEPLVTSTDYVVHIDEGLKLQSGATWGGTLDLSFRTEPFLLRNAYWDEVTVPPLYTGYLVSLDFNAEVDRTSIEGAIRLDPAAGILASADGYSARFIAIVILGGLVPQTQYDLVVDDSLKDVHGHALGADITLEFTTEEFQVVSTTFNGGWYGGEVEPGGDLYARIEFNARVAVDSLNVAASFDPILQGVWIEHATGYPQQVGFEFFPSGPLNLRAEQTYILRLDGTTALAGGVALGEDFLSGFTVQPVRVMSLDPNNGSRNVNVYTNINVYFNTPMNRTVTQAACQLRFLNGGGILGQFSWSDDSRGFAFTPDGRPLPSETTYVFSVSTDAQSQAGPALRSAASSTFRTN